MLLTPSKLRIIELDCPFEQLEDPYVQEIFGKVMLTRKQGYLSRHKKNSLPVDTCDFIGNHYIIAIEDSGKLEPIGGYRTLSLKTATQYNVVFPIINILTSSEAPEVLDALNKKIEALQNSQVEINYVSSWTFSPLTKDNPELVTVMKELITAMNVLSTSENPAQVRFACGSIRLKTDQYIEWLGYQKISGPQGTLPIFHQKNLCGEPAQLMVLDQSHSNEAIQTARRYFHLWQNRLKLIAKTESEQAEIKQAG